MRVHVRVRACVHCALHVFTYLFIYLCFIFAVFPLYFVLFQTEYLSLAVLELAM